MWKKEHAKVTCHSVLDDGKAAQRRMWKLAGKTRCVGVEGRHLEHCISSINVHTLLGNFN